MAAKDVGGFIKSIDERVKTKVDANLKSYNLTLSQGQVLRFLCERDGRATQKEIEECLEVSHPAVVGIVSRMEQNGHLTTWMDPNNKRNKIVQLTPEAEALGEVIDMHREQCEQTMLKGFSPEETTQFLNMLQRVYDNLS